MAVLETGRGGDIGVCCRRRWLRSVGGGGGVGEQVLRRSVEVGRTPSRGVPSALTEEREAASEVSGVSGAVVQQQRCGSLTKRRSGWWRRRASSPCGRPQIGHGGDSNQRTAVGSGR